MNGFSGWLVKWVSLIAMVGSGIGAAMADESVSPEVGKSKSTSKSIGGKESLGALPAIPTDVKRDIDLWRERIKKRVEKLDAMKGLGGFEKLPEKRIAIEQMRGLVDDLDEEARDILEVASGLGPDLAIYRQSLMQAPVMFEARAKRLEAKAAEATSTEIRESYLDWASVVRKMGESYVRQAADIEKYADEVDRRVRFVREAKTMLAELRELLTEIPSQGGEETARLLARITKYAEAFQQSIHAMRGVVDRVGESGPSPGSTPGSPGANAKATSSDSSSTRGEKLLKRLNKLSN